MKKLLLSLIACGSLFGATNMYASDEFTQEQKSVNMLIGTIATTADIATLLFVSPEVYKLVKGQLISVTGFAGLSMGMALGAGFLAFIGCSEFCKLLLLGNSEKMNREVCRINKEQRFFIANCGIVALMACFCNKIAGHIVKDL